jgi:hypothetical protein
MIARSPLGSFRLSALKHHTTGWSALKRRSSRWMAGGVVASKVCIAACVTASVTLLTVCSTGSAAFPLNKTPMIAPMYDEIGSRLRKCSFSRVRMLTMFSISTV